MFSKVADFARLEEWDPFVRSSGLVDGVWMEPGSMYELKSLGGLTLRYRLIEVDRPNRVVYDGGTRRVRSTDAIEVAMTEEGSSVRVVSELRFAGAMVLLFPLIKALVWLGGRYLSLPAMRRYVDDMD